MTSISIGIALIGLIYFGNRVVLKPDNVYESIDSIPVNVSISFINATHDLGISFDHLDTSALEENYIKKYLPLENGPKILRNPDESKLINEIYHQKNPIGPNVQPFYYYSVVFDPFPSVSVADVNNDGFQDIYFTQNKGGDNKLYINNGGKNFKDETSTYKLGGDNTDHSSSSSLFYDFNGDGNLDLLLVKWGCHKLYYGQGPNRPFIEKSELLGGYCSYARMATLVDIDKDGDVDIVFANYSHFETDQSKAFQTTGYYIGNKTHGGENNILLQDNGSFHQAKFNFYNWRSSTHAVGVMDFNNDSWPDLLFTNDYSSDEVWINQQGAGFKEKSSYYLSPYSKHGYSGMNSEVFDTDNDGVEEIYITNSYKPPYQTTVNNFWKRSTLDGPFDRVSEKYEMGRCGFAWGAKFFDANNDGNSELMVVNGRSRPRKDDRKLPSWYDYIELRGFPRFLRSYSKRHQAGVDGFQTLPERSCLFTKVDESYKDISKQAGVDDYQTGRGLALIDYDNDGNMEFVVANRGPGILYHNVSPNKSNWIGLQVSYKNQMAINSTVIFELDNGVKILRRIYPWNGYKGQSDNRIHVGLGDQRVKSIKVIYPDGNSQDVEEFALNQYNKVDSL